MTESVLPLTRKAAAVFGERGFENARLEAELLLAATLGIPRLNLYLQFDRPLAQDELAAYREVVRRRLRGEPLQYIVGEVRFRELTLGVDRRVLIPRPETEVLAGVAIDWVRARAETGRPARTALDIGTGCGAIALSLAQETELAGILGTDISGEALKVARANASKTGHSDRVVFQEGALWDLVTDRFDVIISNPPYIADGERAGLADTVRDWEPAVALFAGPTGLEMLEPLVGGARERLAAQGLLAVEVGLGQASRVAELATEAGLLDARIVLDLSGRERIVTARAP